MDYRFDLLQNDYTLCPPGWGLTDECATFYRIYYVCGGEAYRRVKGKDIPLKQGYLYIFPVMEPYTLWHNPQKPLEVLWFHAECSMDLAMGFEELLVEEGSELYHLLKLMELLQRKAEQFDDVVQLFGILLKQLSSRITLHQASSRRMRKVLEYMEGLSGTYPTVTELADYVGMERSYFTRQFQKEFHMSPQKYLLSRRMNRASRALVEGKSVWEAAKISGYKDEKAFSRAFKAYMEISPGCYRSKHAERL